MGNALLHPFTPPDAGPPLVMVEGRGAWLRDADGREYLDALAGLWCVNVGHGREEIAEAMAEQARHLAFYQTFSGTGTEPALRLAERLRRLSPWPVGRVFFGLSGSDANETQIKLAWLTHRLRGEPRRRKILARRRAYHGVSLGAASATGLPLVHEQFGLPLEGFHHVRTPHLWRECAPGTTEREFTEALARDLEETLEREDPGTVAAFFAEPVMGAGGVLVPPAGYFEAIQPILRHHGVLLVADEVICAFGRLGRWFGGERLGVEPDLVTLAKGLTSGYAPLSACLVSEAIADELADHADEIGVFAHGYTYSGHPVSCAAALANLDLLEGEKLVDRADRVGGYLQQRLRDAFGDHPLVGEVRGLGMLAGVELVADRATREPFPPERGVGRRLHALLREEGLIVRLIGDTLGFSPPLVVGREEVDEITARFARGLERLEAEISRAHAAGSSRSTH